MKVRGHFGMLEYLVKIRTKAIGLHGGDTDTEITGELHDLFNGTLQVVLLKIVATDIYAGNNDLFKSIVYHPTDILQDIFKGTAHRSPPYRRNNAIGAEIITPVLHLDGGAGMETLIDRFKSKYISGPAFRVNHLSFEVSIHQ